MSNNDTAIQLHFALFNGSAGFVLKPRGMTETRSPNANDGLTKSAMDVDAYWPPARDRLHSTTIKVLSLHACPKVACPA